MNDVRAQLEAIAAGKAPTEEPSGAVVNEKAVEKLQADFRPWHVFADTCRNEHGERLTAPAEILVPLP